MKAFLRVLVGLIAVEWFLLYGGLTPAESRDGLDELETPWIERCGDIGWADQDPICQQRRI